LTKYSDNSYLLVDKNEPYLKQKPNRRFAVYNYTLPSNFYLIWRYVTDRRTDRQISRNQTAFLRSKCTGRAKK